MTYRLSTEEKVARKIYDVATGMDESGRPKTRLKKWKDERRLRQEAYRKVARAAMKTHLADLERARQALAVLDGKEPTDEG